MKILGNAGTNNTFTEINISGGVTQICPNVKEVITHNQDTPMTVAEVIQSFTKVVDRFTTASIPIKFDGKEIHHLSTNICQDEKDNYYIDIKIRNK